MFDSLCISQPTTISIIDWVQINDNYFKIEYSIDIDITSIKSESFYLNGVPVFNRTITNGICSLQKEELLFKDGDNLFNLLDDCDNKMSLIYHIRLLEKDVSPFWVYLIRSFASDVQSVTMNLPGFSTPLIDLSIKEELIKLSSKLGLDIIDIKVKENNDGLGMLGTVLNHLLQSYEYILGRTKQSQVPNYIFVHGCINCEGKKEAYELPASLESRGTISLLNLLSELCSSKKVLIYDEPDNMFHPNMFEILLKWFIYENPNKQSQLLITTHNTELLDWVNKTLRTDSIWFVEKDIESLSSNLYSLADFGGLSKIRLFSKAYLNGNFGAIPNIKN